MVNFILNFAVRVICYTIGSMVALYIWHSSIVQDNNNKALVCHIKEDIK